MNYKMIARIHSYILAIEAALMIVPLGISCYVGDISGRLGFIVAVAVALVIGGLFWLLSRGTKPSLYTREGFFCVGSAWVVMSLVGCLPFFVSGQIPNFFDALFEIVSGFTTTGASVVPNVEKLGKGILWWRSFSHWIGGMGILVFFLAIVPITRGSEGFTIHILRAESPGPEVNKMVPRMRDSAKITYLIYIFLTVLDIIFLLIGKMDFFSACCIAFGTAGTGGFSVLNSGCATYTHFAQNTTTVFMLLFGVNFSIYYLIIMRHVLKALKDEELRLYFGIVLSAIVLIAINIYHTTADTMGLEPTIRHAAFQVASIITTTGYSTTNFDLWPSFSKAMLLFLMFVGASAGSTGGGIKVVRVLVLFKAIKRNIHQMFHPREVQVITVNKKRVSERTVNNIYAYLGIYVLIVIVTFLIISTNPGKISLMTHFSAVMATFNNIGPGLEQVGPTANFSIYNNLNTFVLTLAMLFGRLEIYPMIAILSPEFYKKK